ESGFDYSGPVFFSSNVNFLRLNLLLQKELVRLESFIEKDCSFDAGGIFWRSYSYISKCLLEFHIIERYTFTKQKLWRYRFDLPLTRVSIVYGVCDKCETYP